MTSQTVVAGAAPARARGRRFYIYMSLACALTAFAGFSHTYFFRSFAGLPPLSARAHLHGALFTAWMLLFVAQTALVRSDRRDLHRRLGLVGAVLAILMIWVGVTAVLGVTVTFQSTGFRPHGLTPVTFLASQLGMLLQFLVLIALAIGFRRRGEVHKRLMLLATISILPPAIARFHLENYGVSGAFAATLLAYLLIAVAVLHDLVKTRRVHPAYVWGGLGMLAWMYLRAAIGRTESWQSIGQWLIS